jgi:hypothetical protein
MIDGLGSYIYTFCRTDSLMTGVLLAWLVKQDGFLKLAQKFSYLLIIVFSVLLLIIAYLTFLVTQAGDVINHIVFALFFALFILLAMIYQGVPQTGILRNSLLVWMGSRSYGIYLLHQGMSGIWHGLFGVTPPRMSNFEEVTVTVCALISTLLLAEFSFRYYESPFIRLGHKFKFFPAQL